MKLPYGISHFGELRREGYDYVDKTPYIRLLEDEGIGGPCVTLFRPRRFGKTLLMTMLDRYYDLARAHLFDRLFGDLAIAKAPTEERSRYLTVGFSFDGLRSAQGEEALAADFATRVRNGIQEFFLKYWKLLPELTRQWDSQPHSREPAARFRAFLELVAQAPYPLYVFVDAYDAYARNLLSLGDLTSYERHCRGEGFAGAFYREVVRGVDEGIVTRCFISGMCPAGLESALAGTTRFKDISRDPSFAGIAGFKHSAVEQLVEAVVSGRELTVSASELLEIIERDHDGYRFAEGGGEAVYHPDMVIYFLAGLEPPDVLPDQLFDLNLHTDATRFKQMLRLPEGGVRESVLEVVQEVLVSGVPEGRLLDRVEPGRLLEKETVPTVLYQMGILTRADDGSSGKLTVPNGAVRQLFWEAFADVVQSSLPRPVSVADLFRAAQTAAYEGDVSDLFRVIGADLLQQVLWADGMGTLPVPLDQRHMTLILRAFLALADVFRPFVALRPDWLSACVGVPVLVLAPGAGYADARHGLILYLSFLPDGPASPGVCEEALTRGERWLETGKNDPRLETVKLEGGWLTFSVVMDGDGGLWYRAPGQETVVVKT